MGTPTCIGMHDSILMIISDRRVWSNGNSWSCLKTSIRCPSFWPDKHNGPSNGRFSHQSLGRNRRVSFVPHKASLTNVDQWKGAAIRILLNRSIVVENGLMMRIRSDMIDDV
jgi:hypothetical protein